MSDDELTIVASAAAATTTSPSPTTTTTTTAAAHSCAVCDTAATKKCSLCPPAATLVLPTTAFEKTTLLKPLFYCGVAHQKEDWSQHKQVCIGQARRVKETAARKKMQRFCGLSSAAGMDAAGMQAAAAAATNSAVKRSFLPPWLHAPEKRAEWLVNVYRLRSNDAAAAGARAGIYSSKASRRNVCLDFLVFCLLVQRRNLLADVGGGGEAATLKDGDFIRLLLATAAPLLCKRFVRDDAKAKYGGENALMPNSLRSTAEQVYGYSANDVERRHEGDGVWTSVEMDVVAWTRLQQFNDVDDAGDTNTNNASFGAEDDRLMVFAGVGGHKLWNALVNDLAFTKASVISD
jgi:hypothetical protein